MRAMFGDETIMRVSKDKKVGDLVVVKIDDWTGTVVQKEIWKILPRLKKGMPKGTKVKEHPREFKKMARLSKPVLKAIEKARKLQGKSMSKFLSDAGEEKATIINRLKETQDRKTRPFGYKAPILTKKDSKPVK